jgi:hypothetical protein
VALFLIVTAGIVGQEDDRDQEDKELLAADRIWSHLTSGSLNDIKTPPDPEKDALAAGVICADSIPGPD